MKGKRLVFLGDSDTRGLVLGILQLLDMISTSLLMQPDGGIPQHLKKMHPESIICIGIVLLNQEDEGNTH